MFSVVRPKSAGPMLEVGAGIGTFSRLLLDAGADPLVVLEPEEPMVAELTREFGGDDRVEIFAEVLPSAPALRERPAYFRYAVLQNVLEHIEEDTEALAAVVHALEPGGEVVVLVPAHPRLYGRLDREFGHHRRYTRERLQAVISDAGAELVSMRSFNLLGIPGWVAAGRTRAINISGWALRLYEAIVPVWRPIETALQPPVGLSLVARARKPW
jgi:SAM-dependent methyltransferase